jgi:predicted SAM-dependent methyltransferase
MGCIAFLKNLESVAGLVRDWKGVKIRLSRGKTHRAVARYCAGNSVTRLHLGCGDSLPPGWLGTDIAPASSGILCMDATKPFPVPDQSFNYIFCEHMIEHISWSNGASMLKECYRILKPGGKIRIATPDLGVLLQLYCNEVSPDGDNYIRWITDNFIDNGTLYRPAFVINNAFHNWGHRFLYDGELLEIALGRAGFVDITPCRVNESDDDTLRGIELHGKNLGNEKINEFETMVFEARRPPESPGA